MSRTMQAVVVAFFGVCGAACGGSSAEIGTLLLATAKTQDSPNGSANTIAFSQSGKYLFAGCDSGIRVFEFVLGDHNATPRVLSMLKTVVPEFDTMADPNTSQAKVVSLKVNGNLMYAVVGSDRKRLTVIDISDPTSPKPIAQLQTATVGAQFSAFSDLAFAGNTVFAAMLTGLWSYDVTNPSAPVLTHMDALLKTTEALDVQGHTLYVGGDGGITVFDVTDPSMIKKLGQSPSGSSIQAHSFAADTSGFLYTTSQADSSVIDARDPAAIELHSTSLDAMTGWMHAVRTRVVGHGLYVAETGGFRGYDISNPGNPAPSFVLDPHGDLNIVQDMIVTTDGYTVLAHEQGISLYGN